VSVGNSDNSRLLADQKTVLTAAVKTCRRFSHQHLNNKGIQQSMTMLQRAAILTVARGHTAAATLQITLSTLSRMYVDADMPGSCLQKLEKFYKNTLNSDVLFKIFNIFSTLIQIWPYCQQRPRMYCVLRELIAIHILPSMPLLISKSEICTRSVYSG